MSRDRLGGWLSWLVVMGLFCFLCGPWVLPSNTYYHRLIIVLLWIPAFIHFLLLRKGYPPVNRIFAWLYLAISFWYLLVVALTFDDQSNDLRELKIPFYIAFSMLGIMVCAMYLRERFADFILLCCLLGGAGAGLSCIDFYWLQGQHLGERVVSMGSWRVIIPVAQACGALVVLTAMLGFGTRRKSWQIAAILMALIGYGAFLYFNQSRWVWLCLVMAFVGAGAVSRSRAVFSMALISVLLVMVVLLVEPGLLLRRGFSYRPELWAKGIDLLTGHWLHGLGLQRYGVEITSLNVISSHPHNMLLDIGIRFGVPGLLLWMAIWGWAGWRAFQCRHTALGGATMALWMYAGLVVLAEGTAPWVKPAPIWFVTWLPISLALVIDMQSRQRTQQSA